MGRGSRNKDMNMLREYLSEDEYARLVAALEAPVKETEQQWLTRDAIRRREDELAKRASRIDEEAHDDDGIYRRREVLMALVKVGHVIRTTSSTFGGVAAQRYADAHSVLNAVIIAIAKRDTNALKNMSDVANEYQRRFHGDGPVPDIVLLDGRSGHEAEEGLERVADKRPFDWKAPVRNSKLRTSRNQRAEFLTAAEHSRNLLRDDAAGIVKHLGRLLLDQLFVPDSQCLHRSGCAPRDSTRWLDKFFAERLSERATYGGHMDGGFIDAVRCRPALRKEVEAKGGVPLYMFDDGANRERAVCRVKKAFAKALRSAFNNYQEVLDSPGGSEPDDRVSDAVEETARALVQAGLRAIPDRIVPTKVVAKNMYNASRVKTSRERARKKALKERAGKKALKERAGKKALKERAGKKAPEEKAGKKAPEERARKKALEEKAGKKAGKPRRHK